MHNMQTYKHTTLIKQWTTRLRFKTCCLQWNIRYTIWHIRKLNNSCHGYTLLSPSSLATGGSVSMYTVMKIADPQLFWILVHHLELLVYNHATGGCMVYNIVILWGSWQSNYFLFGGYMYFIFRFEEKVHKLLHNIRSIWRYRWKYVSSTWYTMKWAEESVKFI
jgi:hypothetical protein